MKKPIENDERSPAVQENDDGMTSFRRLLDSARENDHSAINKILEQCDRVVSTLVRAHDGKFPPDIDEGQLHSTANDTVLNCIKNAPDISNLNGFKKYTSEAIRNAFANLARKSSCNTRTQWENLAEFNKTKIQISNSLGREPTMEEVYKKLGWGKQKKKESLHSRFAPYRKSRHPS